MMGKENLFAKTLVGLQIAGKTYFIFHRIIKAGGILKIKYEAEK